MLLEIGLLKRKKKSKQKQKQNKTKAKNKKKENCIKSGQESGLYIPAPISTTKDVICCSNGYIYHFLDYITLLLFVNANVIHHV